MTNVKFNSTMLSAYSRYKRSDEYSVYDAYKNCSYAKERAWYYCQELCEKYNGYGLKIIGHNCMQFSAGFEYKDADDNVHFVYITRDYDRDAIILNLYE